MRGENIVLGVKYGMLDVLHQEPWRQDSNMDIDQRVIVAVLGGASARKVNFKTLHKGAGIPFWTNPTAVIPLRDKGKVFAELKTVNGHTIVFLSPTN